MFDVDLAQTTVRSDRPNSVLVVLSTQLDPILALLALYSQQGNRTTGVPQAITVLRVLNFIVLLLFSVSVAYTGVYLSNWNAALERPRWTNEDSWPAYDPPNFTRIAPLVASIIFLAIVAGAALL